MLLPPIRMLAPAWPLSQVLLVPGRARLFTTATNGHCTAKLVSRPQDARSDVWRAARAVDRNWQAGEGRLLFEYLPKVIEPTPRSTGDSLNLKFIPVPQAIAGGTSPAISRFGLSRHARRHMIWVAIAAIADMVDIAETMWMTLSRHRVRYSKVRSSMAFIYGCPAPPGPIAASNL